VKKEDGGGGELGGGARRPIGRCNAASGGSMAPSRVRVFRVVATVSSGDTTGYRCLGASAMRTLP
jgi:hypothetical protein